MTEQPKHWEYSAIMDEKTCGACAESEGHTADNPDELPPAPNPECTSDEGCRCFHVGVFV